ncbi:hypothetical protein J8F10_02680 [Gemmata sp. G18]|uniref:Uncharacterized protein n=1 Tax=Gemmata palustris TaxID=2822762 RepID=A0ABS5BKH1_9BACT|nr:hypothetical protein [Gemmata palustris]MBP3954202.1 hypothetical protein [Gemmata palustris]
MGNAWILHLVILTLVSSFIGAIVLRASLRAANVMIRGGRRRVAAVPLPSLDWSITLLMIANVLNFVINWGVTQFVTDLAFINPADIIDTAFASALVSLPFNVLVLVLVLMGGLPTTFPRACLIVLFQVLFSVIFGVVAVALALGVVFLAWSLGVGGGPNAVKDLAQNPVVIAGIIAGVVLTGIGLAVGLAQLEERGDRNTRAPRGAEPTRAQAVPVAPARVHLAPETGSEPDRGQTQPVTVLMLLAMVFGMLIFGLTKFRS